MFCPFCKKPDTKVLDSRLVHDGYEVRRRRECINCTERFTTYEAAELVLPKVIKSDGRREPFDEEKLLYAIERALLKRPVTEDQLKATIHGIKHQIRTMGDREISATVIGDLVMQKLKDIDKVGYMRFASVYRSFQDINEFKKEITKLKKSDGV